MPDDALDVSKITINPGGETAGDEGWMVEWQATKDDLQLRDSKGYVQCLGRGGATLTR